MKSLALVFDLVQPCLLQANKLRWAQELMVFTNKVGNSKRSLHSAFPAVTASAAVTV